MHISKIIYIYLQYIYKYLFLYKYIHTKIYANAHTHIPFFPLYLCIFLLLSLSHPLPSLSYSLSLSRTLSHTNTYTLTHTNICVRRWRESKGWKTTLTYMGRGFITTRAVAGKSSQKLAPSNVPHRTSKSTTQHMTTQVTLKIVAQNRNTSRLLGNPIFSFSHCLDDTFDF